MLLGRGGEDPTSAACAGEVDVGDGIDDSGAVLALGHVDDPLSG
ncbi:hypothetical protein [Rhodococcus sp. OK302]|nr:hypothetical protein [Rhodococcus sp. OK302]